MSAQPPAPSQVSGSVQIVSAGSPQAVPAGANYDPVIDPNAVVCGTYNAGTRAARSPRVLDQNGNTTFKGVIIADQVSQVNGNAIIIGALISLTTIDVNINPNGSAEIFYSCDAINAYTGQSYNQKLSWHRRF